MVRHNINIGHHILIFYFWSCASRLLILDMATQVDGLPLHRADRDPILCGKNPRWRAMCLHQHKLVSKLCFLNSINMWILSWEGWTYWTLFTPPYLVHTRLSPAPSLDTQTTSPLSSSQHTDRSSDTPDQLTNRWRPGRKEPSLPFRTALSALTGKCLGGQQLRLTN